MRKILRVLALLAISPLILIWPVHAQQEMNNAAVLKLLKAGLSDDLIVNTINGSPGKYDTSADALFALRNAGADSKVISAILMKSAPGPPPAPGTLANPAVPAPNIPAGVDDVGIYYQARNGSWKNVLAETVTRRTGGMLRSFATEGKIKGDVIGDVKQSSSSLTLTLPASFILYVPEGSSAGEYRLLRFHVHENDRIFLLEAGGALHRSASEAKDSVDFDSKEVAPRVYQVTFGHELGKGEYGFLAPNDASDLESSAGSAKMFTFSAVE